MKKALLCALFWCGFTHAADALPHWGYTGAGAPGNWGKLDTAFAACRLGKAQSPIDIRSEAVRRATRTTGTTPIAFHYTLSDATVVNNGHSIQIGMNHPGAITLPDGEYRLTQFHFHAPAEERIKGKTYPMNIHLVHARQDGRLAVVAVLLKVGKENTVLREVFASLPQKGQTKPLADRIDPSRLLPASHAYYAYTGSLTTPPCSEDVQWFVLKRATELSPAQIAAFRQFYPANARPVQPLNGRWIYSVP
ncbi:MAG: carbonic anhydrase family protein [Burkholderiaceae bacterium]|jgi:carbonic anhydrase|nr:carbonic anhydrase family protein [Burkholderiaceae bacterium]